MESVRINSKKILRATTYLPTFRTTFLTRKPRRTRGARCSSALRLLRRKQLGKQQIKTVKNIELYIGTDIKTKCTTKDVTDVTKSS